MENWNWRNEREAFFGALQGLTLKSIEGMKEGEEVITFTTECGRVFKMYHDQNCCESVYLADVAGDVEDLIGSPIRIADESTKDDPEADECGMWTFYKLATAKGYVDLRWYGSSNGYYSVGVDFVEVKVNKDGAE